MNRIKAAFHLLMGHSLMYKIHVAGGVTLACYDNSADVVVADCVFTKSGPAMFTIEQIQFALDESEREQDDLQR